MRIHFVHPKFLSDELLQEEHDFIHRLFDALSEDGKGNMDHPDLFRFRARRGQLYVRHRKIVEEMGIRGMTHETLIDRRNIEPDEWGEMEMTPQEIFAHAGEAKVSGPGRVTLPETDSPDEIVCPMDICSAVPDKVDLDILRGLWAIYRYVVMERSYRRYRSLADPVQGRGRGSVWMLFDLMMEEAFAQVPEDRAPGIAYETIWEELQRQATLEEAEEYGRLTADLKPGKVSLDIRRFLAAAAAKQGNTELKTSALLNSYIP
jgi:hypothetical protein